MGQTIVLSSSVARRGFRVVSAGHALFALMLIWLGVMGVAKGDFVPVWQTVPAWVPARTAVAYLCALVSLGAGIGLLWQRTAPVAARVVLVSFAVWLVVLRLPYLFIERPLVLVAWSCGSTAVMVA